MDAAMIERQMHLAEMAVGSAILNGADPDEVRRRVEVGIAEATDLNARRPSARAEAGSAAVAGH